MKKNKICLLKKSLSVLLVAFMLFGNGVSFAVDNVTPDVGDMDGDAEVMFIGSSIVVDKEVITPVIPPKIDIMFLFDLSGSFADDLVNIKLKSGGLFDDIEDSGSDFRLGISSFIDYNLVPFGSPTPSGTPYPYRLDQDFTNDKGTWTTSINSMVAFDGYDEPESQYDALVGASSSGSWREDAEKVIVIATDASFHNPDDTGAPSGFPGVDYPGINNNISTISELGDITVIGLTPGLNIIPQLKEIVDATDGSYLSIGLNSSDIADAILEGLGNLDVTVIPDVTACGPLEINFDEDSKTTTSGSGVIFIETITVPDDLSLAGTEVHCDVIFNDENGNEIGRQNIWVEIPKVLECVATTNPHGKNIPKAGVKSKGQNEDGFYQLFGYSQGDDEVMKLSVNGFDVDNGENVKITEAPGVEPKEKKMGSTNAKGKANAVPTHFILDTDAELTVTYFPSGKTYTTSCLVPPMPK